MISYWPVPLLLGVLVASGCGGDRPKLVPVAGKVTHKSQPLTAGSIIFHPDASNGYQKDRPSSLLQLDGSFTMKTFPFGDGVPPGQYKATLAPEVAGRIRLPKYADPAKTPWIIDITETGNSELILEVK